MACRTAAGMPLTEKLQSEMPQSEVLASWYGKQHDGRPTASGERFDRKRLTAAHPWLPFGTVLRVMNAGDGRFVYVKVNDRGPFVAEREIDLSEAAASKIGIKNRGEAPVFIDLAVKTELPLAREMMKEAAQIAAREADGDDDRLSDKIARIKGR